MIRDNRRACRKDDQAVRGSREGDVADPKRWPLEPLLLRVDQTAALLNLSEAKVRQMIADGTLPSVTVGRARRVPADALKRWLTDCLNKVSTTAE